MEKSHNTEIVVRLHTALLRAPMAETQGSSLKTYGRKAQSEQGGKTEVRKDVGVKAQNPGHAVGLLVFLRTVQASRRGWVS